MNIAFTGDRNYRKEYFAVLWDWFEANKSNDDNIWVGDCPTGVDAIVRLYVNIFNRWYKQFLADWGKYGKAAGPIRNKELLQGAHELIYVHHDLSSSKGTANCVAQAVELQIPVINLLESY